MFPEVDPQWFSRKDMGLADTVYYNLRDLLQGEGGITTAEELYQEIVTGVGASSKDDLPGAVGKKYSRKILTGDMGPRVFKPGIKNIVRRRALDALKKQHTRDKNLNNPLSIGPGMDDDAVDIDPADVVDTLSPMQAIALIMSGPKGRDFLRWAYKLVETKGSESQRAVFEAYVADPDSSNRQLAEMFEAAMGKSISPQMAGRHRDNSLKLIKAEIAKNPKVLDWVQDALALQGLDDIDAVQMAKLPLRWKGRRASISRVAWAWVRAAGWEVSDLLRDYDRGSDFNDFVSEFVGDVLDPLYRRPSFEMEVDGLEAKVDSRGKSVEVSGDIYLTMEVAKSQDLVRTFEKAFGRWARKDWPYSPKVTDSFLFHRRLVEDLWNDTLYDLFASNDDLKKLVLEKMIIDDNVNETVDDELGGNYEQTGRWFPTYSDLDIDTATFEPKSGLILLKGTVTLALAITEVDNWTAEDARYDEMEQRGLDRWRGLD